MRNNILPRVCRECGAAFQGGPRAWYCLECRAERKKVQAKEYKQRKKAGKSVPVGSLIKCEICGKEIIKSGGSQRFCPECAAKHLKEIDNQQSLEWKKSNPEKVRESKRKMSKERHANGESFESGVKGVTWDKGKKKWIVNINYRGKQYRVAQTSDKDIAIQIMQESDSFMDACIKALKEKYATSSEEDGSKKNDNEKYRNADMSKLSDNQRACLLDYLNGMRAQDIADKYGINKPVVYNRIREAKRIIDTGSAHSPEEVKKRKEYAKKYYQEHKDELKAYSRQYAADHPEAVKEANRRNYKKNREERVEQLREYNRKYYARNRDQILAKSKARAQDRMVDENILKAFNKSGTVNGAAEETGYSWNRVIKSLSSSGVVINDTHKIILDLCESGMAPEQIAKQVGISVKTVQAYLPRVRPVYGENRSKNATKINEWRNKRKEV